jgi:CheY-like chemotaxis protein
MSDRLDGMRILVVDDDDDGRFLLTIILRGAGASVIAASSALQALAFYQVEPVDLIVSDIRMPRLDGYELIRMLRANEPPDGSRVLAVSVTGTGRGDEAERALAAGFDAHITRPVEASLLLETIRLAREQGRQTALVAQGHASQSAADLSIGSDTTPPAKPPVGAGTD